MVKIKIYSNQQGQVTACELTGHADAGAKGHDIVCAGISALTQTALLGLAKHLKVKLTYEVKEGFLSFCLQEQPNDLTEAVLQTMIIGLSEIAKGYSKNVYIEYLEVN